MAGTIEKLTTRKQVLKVRLSIGFPSPNLNQVVLIPSYEEDQTEENESKGGRAAQQ